MLTKLVAVMTLLAWSSVQAQETPIWEFPNFSDRVQLQVTNPRDLPYDGVASVSLSQVQAVAPEFPGSLLLASDDGAPSHSIESEVDLADKEFYFAVHLQPKQTRTILAYYSQTLHDTLPVVPRVFAAHSYGYNRATAALESERIGYRTYGALMLDVQTHAKNEYGLFNALMGYASIGHPMREGRDVVHLGDTLGLGGLFLRSGGDVFRPPFSTPDYTHHAPKPNEPTYKVISSGPLRAIVEEDIVNWEIGGDAVAVRMQYEIDVDQEVVHCHWWLAPLRISRAYEVGAGVRDLDAQGLREVRGAFATTGTQSATDGAIALGLAYGSDATRAGKLSTPEASNEIVMFAGRLTPHVSVEGEYTLAAAWSGSGWSDPGAHVLDLLESQAVTPRARVIAHERTPHPEALEKEPQ